MDLEVVGRHALLFDDDSLASFVNSPAALVEWNSLFIDRYDVRHLLSSPPPPRSKRRRHDFDDPDLKSELDRERYLDLPEDSPSPPPDQKDLDDGSGPANSVGFHAVPFSYGYFRESNDQKNADTESGFRPPFTVPESLLQNLRLGAEMELTKVAIHRHLVSFAAMTRGGAEKLHQIIARTALFVSKHGGQSEIVLRVKQGGNPTFGFLMPDHHLHPYFRFLVDHQELLTGKSIEEDKINTGGQAGGALTLLGSVYGTGEYEDTKNESVMEEKRSESDEGDDTVKAAGSDGPDGVDGTKKLAMTEQTVSKHPLPVKDKASLIKRNPSVGTINVVDKSKIKNEGDNSEKLSASAIKSQPSVMPTPPKFELPIVEPPADMKRVIDKIVEFILRNGKEFEAILAEQDVKYGRFPFLLPASLYHAYYRKVLQEAEESKLSGKDSGSEKQDKKQGKKANVVREGVQLANGTQMLDDPAKKEKFKMAIGKPKEDGQEAAKPARTQVGVTVDADAAAAILQAATRGIKNPNWGILSGNTSNETSQVLHSSSYPSSGLNENMGRVNNQLVSAHSANAIAKTAALAAAGEADSSEAGLTKEQKLKAERLKRAKMFVAMIKGGANPLKAEPTRSLSLEPSDSGISLSGTNAAEPAVKERESSLCLCEAEKKLRGDEFSERRSKRKYRSRSGRNEDDENEEEEEENIKENTEETKEEKWSSRRRHSERSRDRHKHKRRHSSKDRGSQGGYKYDDLSDDEHHKRSRRRHRHSKSSHKHDHDDPSDNEHHRRHRSSKHKHDDSSDDEHRHQHRSSKHKRVESSDGDEQGHWHRSRKHRNGETKTADEDIVSKSDTSKSTDDYKASREASVNLLRSSPDAKAPSEQNEAAPVSDELRAKIRAMLMGTL